MSSSPDMRLDEDLYCLECGYNLRGLSGDPRRCPECGHKNPLSELTIPAAAIRAHLTKLESAPTWAIAATLAMALGLLMLAAGGFVCALMLVTPGVLVLLISIQEFGRNSKWQPGWGGVLGWFYAAGACMFVPFVAGFVVIFSFPSLRNIAAIPIVGITLVAGALGWPVYTRAKRQLAMLQRATAIELAKQALDQQLHRKR